MLAIRVRAAGLGEEDGAYGAKSNRQPGGYRSIPPQYRKLGYLTCWKPCKIPSPVAGSRLWPGSSHRKRDGTAMTSTSCPYLSYNFHRDAIT